MRLDHAALARLARLSGEWVDLADEARAAWLEARSREHPALAEALRAMTSLPSRGTGSTGDTLSPPAWGDAAGDVAEFAAGALVGPYRLVCLLGRGGMGEVWRAEQADGRVQRGVALKLPLPGLTHRSWRRRFERERDILAALDHPGIAKLFDADVTPDGQPWMAMQYVPGEPLTRHAARLGLGLVARVRLFAQLLEVVQHAHGALVVHRDLKPGNILVDDRGRLTLLDFGIAKLLAGDARAGAGELTELAGNALTLDYASPEQVSEQPVGVATDVYSAGVVLYELLAGQRPYRLRRASRAAMEQAVLEQDIAPPSARVQAPHATQAGTTARALARQMRGDLDAIVSKALRKKPEQRYATAQAFADDLQRWLRKEPVRARPDSLGYRARRLLGRHWQWFAIGAATFSLLLAATVVALVQASVARQASLLARNEARQAEAVTAFMQTLFLGNGVRQVDPAMARKRTAEQLMDDAAARIDTALADAPEQQVRLLDRMARMYYEMRRLDRAVGMARHATELARRTFGPDAAATHAEEAMWMDFAAIDGDAVVLDQRMQFFVDSLPVLATSADPTQRSLAIQLGVALTNRDFLWRPQPALRVVEILDPLVETADPNDTPDIRHMMGVIDFQNLRLADARRHFAASERVESPRGTYAQGDESYPTWYGRLEALTGHYARAEALMLEGYRRERHNDAGADRVNDWGLAAYARFLADSGRPAQALTLLQTGGELASPQIRARLDKSWRSILARSHALAALGRSEEALALARQGSRILLEGGSPEAPSPTDEVEALLVSGQPLQALAIVDREEPRYAQARASMGARLLAEFRVRGLVALGRATEARASLEQQRAILMPAEGGLAESARFTWLEAGVMLLEGRAAEARVALESRLAQMAQADADTRQALRGWEGRLQARQGEADLAQGQADAARAACAAAAAAYEGVVDTHASMAFAGVAAELARLARDGGDASAARRWQARADAIAARHPHQQGWGA